MTIGALAQRTGFNVSAIRYYEEVGLIPKAMRHRSGHRVYFPDVQEVLTLVKPCRDFGFSIDETRALVSLSSSDDRDCVEGGRFRKRKIKHAKEGVHNTRRSMS